MARPVIAIALLVLTYTWVGYPILLWLLRQVYTREVGRLRHRDNPIISIIIAARNEEERIAAKLMDCTNLDYPPDRLEILIVSDNSTDKTEEIVMGFGARDARIRLLVGQSPMGKSGAQNLGVLSAAGEILFFTDADTHIRPDTLMLLLENFADPQVGLVTTDVYLGDPVNTVAEGQGIYWRFELFLRKLESELGILATGSGQLLMMRRELFHPIPVTYGDDCVLPLDVRLQGYRVVQDTRVVVFDTMPSSIRGELRARVRMTTRNWTGTLSRPEVLNPLRFPLTSWALISHKLLRWLTPFFMIALLSASVRLAVGGEWIVFCMLQTAFYAGAGIGWQCSRNGAPARLFGYPFAFCLANFGFLLGMVKAFRGQKIVSY